MDEIYGYVYNFRNAIEEARKAGKFRDDFNFNDFPF